MEPTYRIGHGYDLHRLVKGRTLVLGGVVIPYPKGLEGHSDADCLTHAIADAILGGVCLPDIGHFFPDTDPAFKDIDSLEILKRANAEAAQRGFSIVNIDSTVVAQEPKLSPSIGKMRRALAGTLRIPLFHIGIKATTNEGVGVIGRGEAIAAYAVALLIREAGSCRVS